MTDGDAPAPWGRVDPDGTVYVRTADGERAVGQVPDVPESEALAFFTRRFDALELEVSLLERRVRSGALPPDDAAGSIKTVRKAVTDANAVGDLDGLLTQLAELREREAPEGIEAAEDAVRRLKEVIGDPPQLASPARLDAIGAAARRLEQELSPGAPSPFVATMRAADGVVGELQREIEAGYRISLDA